MKKILASALLIIGVFNYAVGQKNTYGISFGVGGGMIMKKELEGGASYDLNRGTSFGFQYTRRMSNKLHLLTGINWYKNNITMTPNVPPNADIAAEHYDVQLLYIPIFLKVDLSKYFFIGTGLIADIDVTKERYNTSQSGMGAGVAMGAEIPFSDKVALQLSPYLNFHGLLLTQSEEYPERILDSGIRVTLLLKN